MLNPPDRSDEMRQHMFKIYHFSSLSPRNRTINVDPGILQEELK